MITLTDRVTRYLLARLRRQTMHQVYDAAAEAGLLETVFIDRSQELGRVWQLPQEVPLTLSGNNAEDRQRLARLLQRSKSGPASIHQLRLPDEVRLRSAPQHRRGRGERPAAAGCQRSSDGNYSRTPPMTSTEAAGTFGSNGRSQRDEVLRLLRSFLLPTKVADVAVALLVARAVGESTTDLRQLFEVLQQPDAMIVIKIPVAGFEDQFGTMLEAGLIVRSPAVQVDGFGQKSLSGSFREPPSDVVRVVTFRGNDIVLKTEAGVRAALARARARPATPCIIADETTSELPERLVGGADLVLTLAAIDVAFIVELLQICAGAAPSAAIAAINRVGLDPSGLGLDDLVLAIRPARGVDRIIETLKLFAEEKRQEVEEDGDDDAATRTKPVRKTPAKSSPGKANVQFEVTQPEPVLSAVDEGAVRPAPTVETASGYGEARSWALDLKSDLALWRSGELDWAAMGTRLLLSGPPGTGKTTFARALRNSLQVPMIATSVSHWLEPGYLGDVLKTMTSAFDAAKAQSPCLLFIDELDNIGTRGRSGQHSDYWDSLINRMLELLDGSNQREGIIIVGATNHPGRIDPALLRSGRLERHVVIPPPDIDTLAGILLQHLGTDLARVLDSSPLNKGSVDPGLREGGGLAPRVMASGKTTGKNSMQKGKPL